VLGQVIREVCPEVLVVEPCLSERMKARDQLFDPAVSRTSTTLRSFGTGHLRTDRRREQRLQEVGRD
jgi:hypothetical protein